MHELTPPPQTRGTSAAAVRAQDLDAFEVFEAEGLAGRWRAFIPLVAGLLVVLELLAQFIPAMPKNRWVTAGMVGLLAALYLLVRARPHRAAIGWATVAASIGGAAYAATASAQTGRFLSPHMLAMSVVTALLPAVLSVSALEATATMVGSITAWILVNLFWQAGTGPASTAGLTTTVIYLTFLGAVTVATVAANRRLRLAEFLARREAERAHRFTVEEVLYRHLPARYVEQLLSGAHAIDAPPERRTVTILFADLVGFTSLSENLLPDELARLMARFYDLVGTIAASHGGTIDKFVGDAAMAMFGAPEPMPPEEQAKRAVAMACEWQRDVADLLPGGVRLTLRIGIHQDAVVVGSFGGRNRTDYTVLGRGVNIAARLEQQCRPGAILVSSEVRDLVSSLYATADAGQLRLKGIPEPVAAFEIDPDAAVAVPAATPEPALPDIDALREAARRRRAAA